MARRGSSTAEATTDKTVQVADEVTTNTTAPADSTATKAEKPAAVPVDLAPFKEAVATALDSADPNTGKLTTEALAPVNKVYRQIDKVEGKDQARGWVEDQSKAATWARVTSPKWTRTKSACRSPVPTWP